MRKLLMAVAGLASLAVLVSTTAPANAGDRSTSAYDSFCDACDNWNSGGRSRRCHGCRGCCHGCCCAKCKYWACCGIYPLNGGYVDPRDTVLYSAQGYNMPMAVPLAPVVKNQYNYGWGLPSSRITRPGFYANYWPSAFTSQAGNPATRGNHPPQVYWATDTTQLGYYGTRVPHWVQSPVPFNNY